MCGESRPLVDAIIITVVTTNQILVCEVVAYQLCITICLYLNRLTLIIFVKRK